MISFTRLWFFAVLILLFTPSQSSAISCKNTFSGDLNVYYSDDFIGKLDLKLRAAIEKLDKIANANKSNPNLTRIKDIMKLIHQSFFDAVLVSEIYIDICDKDKINHEVRRKLCNIAEGNLMRIHNLGWFELKKLIGELNKEHALAVNKIIADPMSDIEGFYKRIGYYFEID